MNGLKRALGAAMMIMLVTTAASAQTNGVQPVIQVKPVVEVVGKQEITLGDIVEMRGVSEAVAAAIRDVRLADAPGAGETRTFTDVGLSQILRVHLREVMQKTGEIPAFRIPSRVKVVRKTFQIRAEDVDQEIKKNLKSLCQECDFEISGLSVPAVGANVPAEASWTLKMKPEIPRGSFSIPIEVSLGENARRLFWVNGTLSVRRNVPVAARIVNIGEKMMPEDFTMQIKDVTHSNDAPASSSEISNSVVARQVAAGQIVWRSQLRREQAVKTGDIVKVVVGGEEWQVMADGVAQTGGYIGDMIRVKIPRTQKLVSGLLKEKGLVEVR